MRAVNEFVPCLSTEVTFSPQIKEENLTPLISEQLGIEKKVQGMSKTACANSSIL